VVVDHLIDYNEMFGSRQGKKAKKDKKSKAKRNSKMPQGNNIKKDKDGI
jgi:hypothetical protein